MQKKAYWALLLFTPPVPFYVFFDAMPFLTVFSLFFCAFFLQNFFPKSLSLMLFFLTKMRSFVPGMPFFWRGAFFWQKFENELSKKSTGGVYYKFYNVPINACVQHWVKLCEQMKRSVFRIENCQTFLKQTAPRLYLVNVRLNNICFITEKEDLFIQ